jgi:hypothetical protein
MLIAILVGFSVWARSASPGIGRWLEAARRQAFETNTGTTPPPATTLAAANGRTAEETHTIDDEDSLTAYNNWLARLGREHQPP